jgi:hypothetical protein
MAVTPEGMAAAERLREYWLHGAGSVKIRWGTPHDFDRCVEQIREHTNMTDPEGYCNRLHQRAVGAPPGKGH